MIPDQKAHFENQQVAHDTSAAREAVGIFDDQASFQAAIDDLLTAGFARCELSVLKQHDATGPSEPAEVAADDPRAPRTDFFCVEAQGDAEGALVAGFAMVPAMGAAAATAAAGATIAATAGVTIATGGTGALIGAALAIMLARRHHAKLAAQQEHGGLLLWVHTRTRDHERRAVEILTRHAAHNVHSHERPL